MKTPWASAIACAALGVATPAAATLPSFSPQPCGIIVVASVPEPGTLALLGLGLLGLGVMRRRAN